MGISLLTHKKLWGNAANRCAFKECRKELAVDNFGTDDNYTIGDEAHIISEKPNGPRYNKDFPVEQVDKNENLILLCKIHHKQIDSDEKHFTVVKLRQLKREHEEWVRSSLRPDQIQQKDDELFAAYIDQIVLLANFDNWTEWTRLLLGGGTTAIDKKQFEKLIVLHRYIRGRVYPSTRENLRQALDQFNEVLEDFINEFDLFRKQTDVDKEYYITEQRYRTGDTTIEKQVLHDYMLDGFIIELTKAGNYLCQQIRKTIFPSFRLKEGILLLSDVPAAGIAYLRYEYAENEKYCGYIELRERTIGKLGDFFTKG